MKPSSSSCLLLKYSSIVFLKLIWPAAPFSGKKILSAPPPQSIFTFITHRCNETFKLKIFKLFIGIHCCKIHSTNKKKIQLRIIINYCQIILLIARLLLLLLVSWLIIATATYTNRWNLNNSFFKMLFSIFLYKL